MWKIFDKNVKVCIHANVYVCDFNRTKRGNITKLKLSIFSSPKIWGSTQQSSEGALAVVNEADFAILFLHEHDVICSLKLEGVPHGRFCNVMPRKW